MTGERTVVDPWAARAAARSPIRAARRQGMFWGFVVGVLVMGAVMVCAGVMR